TLALRSTPQRERGQLRPRGPAFGALLERDDGLLVERQVHDLGVEASRFVQRKAQLVDADLSERTTSPRARQRERRLAAAEQHQAQAGWTMLEQPRDRSLQS